MDRLIDRIRRRARREEGMTLLELLTAETIGGFVVTVAIMMVIFAVRSADRVTDRVSSAQNGRGAMEQINQRLRSQTCLYPSEFWVNGQPLVYNADESGTNTGGGSNGEGSNNINEVAQPAFLHASPTKMIFIGDIGNGGGSTSITGTASFRPQLRWIEVVTEATGRRTQIREGWRSAANSASPFNFVITPLTTFWGFAPAAGAAQVAPASVRALAEGITGVTAGVPYFQYYDAADNQLTNGPSEGLPTSSLGKVTRVHVAFGFNAEARAENDRRTAGFENDIYLRTSADRCR